LFAVRKLLLIDVRLRSSCG